MNGEIKDQHHNEQSKQQKYKRVIALMDVAIVFFIMVWVTPAKQVMAMGVERVFIYIDEYMNHDEIESEMPDVEDLKLSVRQIKSISNYEMVTMKKQDLYKGDLILVNSQHDYKFLEDRSLAYVNEMKNSAYKLMDQTMMLNREMLVHLNKMLEAFKQATGKHDIILTSGYRSMKEQGEILKEKINLLGDQEALDWAMLPGYSEHHSGYAVDVSIYTDQGNYIRYKGQDEYGWINQNCYKYGLIRRYSGEKKEITGVANEEWHYRYVSVPHSYIVTAKNFCFEEYIEYLKQYTVDQKHLMVRCPQGRYEIYFVPCEGDETKVPVPREKEYSVLGNNVDGFIVTIKR